MFDLSPLFFEYPGLLGELALAFLASRPNFLALALIGLGLEAFGLGLVFLALALFKAKVKVTNLPNTVCLGIITLITLVYQLTDLLWIIEFCFRLQLQAITIEFDLSLDLWPWPWSWP